MAQEEEQQQRDLDASPLTSILTFATISLLQPLLRLSSCPHRCFLDRRCQAVSTIATIERTRRGWRASSTSSNQRPPRKLLLFARPVAFPLLPRPPPDCLLMLST